MSDSEIQAKHHETFKNIMNVLIDSIQLYYYEKENQFHCFSASEGSQHTQWFIWRVQSFKSKTNQSQKQEATLLFGQVYPVEKQNTSLCG